MILVTDPVRLSTRVGRGSAVPSWVSTATSRAPFRTPVSADGCQIYGFPEWSPEERDEHSTH